MKFTFPISGFIVAFLLFSADVLAQTLNTYDYLTGKKDPLAFDRDFYQAQREREKDVLREYDRIQRNQLLQENNDLLRRQNDLLRDNLYPYRR